MTTQTDENIEQILAEIQRGNEIRIGGSRCHRYFRFKDNTWIIGDFDEGYCTDRICTRTEFIAHIKHNFEHFKALLKLPHQRIIQEALHANDKLRALQHLECWEAIGDHLQSAPVLRAFLQWPDTIPNDETKDLIRKEIRSFTAYHVLMIHLNFTQTKENGLLGLKYLETLISIVGEVPNWRHLRGTFREMSGDIQGALEDIQYTLDTLSPEEHFQVAGLRG